MPRYNPVQVEEAFWSKVQKTETCWLWVGGIAARTGYGVFSNAGRLIGAHRYLLEPIPQGLEVDHLCRVRRCVRPDHLELVTPQINVLRGTSPSAYEARQTHCINGHEFSVENTYHRKDRLGRQCKTCSRLRKHKRRNTARPIEEEKE